MCDFYVRLSAEDVPIIELCECFVEGTPWAVCHWRPWTNAIGRK